MHYVLITFAVLFLPALSTADIDSTSLNGLTFSTGVMYPCPIGGTDALWFSDTSWVFAEREFLQKGHRYEIVDGSRLNLYIREDDGLPTLFASGTINETQDEIFLRDKTYPLMTTSVISSDTSPASGVHLLRADLRGRNLYSIKGKRIKPSTFSGIMFNPDAVHPIIQPKTSSP